VSKLDSYNPSRAKLEMTSLNSHSAGIYFGTRYMVLSAWRGEKKTPTDTMPMGGQKREMLKRVNPMLTPLFYYCIPDANEKSEPVTPYGL